MPPAVDAAELSSMLGRWTTGTARLGDDLLAGLVDLIEAGLVPGGATLPPQRSLASALNVSRGTVTGVYTDLEARGYVVTRQGSGTRIRSRPGIGRSHSGRLFSFTAAPIELVDLSTGALPASRVARETLRSGAGGDIEPYLATDGYFPAGLPVLRRAISDRLTRDGTPTAPQEILVTAGAQQATWLVMNGLLASGDRALVEEPSYRGALEAIRATGAHSQGIPLVDGGIDPDHVAVHLRHRAALLYCQPGIHNPTGGSMAATALRALAGTIDRHGVVTVEDRCSADLTFDGPAVAPGLAGLIDPDLHITIGTTSKLLWGGLRVGWVRASERRIRQLSSVRASLDLAGSVLDQLTALRMMGRVEEARAERRALLAPATLATESQIHDVFPDWTWDRPRGGSCMWIETGVDAASLVEVGARVGVRLAAGPAFSSHGGFRRHLRVPVWHDPDLLRTALEALRDGIR